MVFIDLKTASTGEDIQWVDCRHDLTDPNWGKTQFDREHIPGAVFAHLDHDLSGTITERSGRHPLPQLKRFVKWLEQNGLSPDKKIVGYDNMNGGIAARLWWMLTQLRYPQVHILLGTFEAWKDRGLPTATTPRQPRRATIDLPISSWEEGPYAIKSLQEMEQIVPSATLIDSRAEERYLGNEEPYDRIAGHIPGAINLPWSSSLTDGLELKPDLDSLGIDLKGLSKYTVYCGSGVTACFNLAIFAELGLPRPALYAGSYSEWSRNHPDRIEV